MSVLRCPGERRGGCGEVVRAKVLGPSRPGEFSPRSEPLLSDGGRDPPSNCGTRPHRRQQRRQLTQNALGLVRVSNTEEGTSSPFDVAHRWEIPKFIQKGDTEFVSPWHAGRNFD